MARGVSRLECPPGGAFNEPRETRKGQKVKGEGWRSFSFTDHHPPSDWPVERWKGSIGRELASTATTSSIALSPMRRTAMHPFPFLRLPSTLLLIVMVGGSR